MIRRDKPILYVDDTVEQRYAMCRILDREGYRSVQAGTGAEALAALSTDLLAIVLDVKLPDISGYEVCRRIKAHPDFGGIPVIQVSASFADPDHRSAGLSGGADAYIAQPVHPQELLNLVRSVIRSSDAERMLRFLAQLGPRTTRSLDLAETVHAVETAVAPYFADRCELLLLAAADGTDTGTTDNTDTRDATPLPASLQAAVDAVHAGHAPVLVKPGDGSSVMVAALATAGTTLGAVLFRLGTEDRSYTEADLVYAGDLADRIALALNNARLYSVQLTTQEALIQSEKLAAAGRLSAAIAHELNNPLEAITNLLYLIETDTGSSEGARNFAREALSELERLSHITRQSLGFYRELTTAQDFNVSENVGDTLSLYARRLTARGIQIATDYDESLTVHAVRGEIRQVVSNLIVNALDAMEQGGHLSVRTFVAEGGEAVISVRDDGAGIPETIQGRIFEPFFTTKPGTGTGLGLWVSDTIIRKHRGRFELESRHEGPERGTTMTVLLPRA